MTDFGTEDVGNEVGPFAYTRNLLGELNLPSQRAEAVYAEIDFAEAALREIQAVQPATLEKLRSNGVVFGSIGNDPTNWQHVAFTIYTDLCEVDSIARQALTGLAEPVDDRQRDQDDHKHDENRPEHPGGL